MINLPIVLSTVLGFLVGYLVGLSRERIKDDISIMRGNLRGLKTHLKALRSDKIKIIPKKQVMSVEQETMENLDKRLEV